VGKLMILSAIGSFSCATDNWQVSKKKKNKDIRNRILLMSRC
jgi:hypothetical protein